MPDPFRKLAYMVVQEGRDGAPIEIAGANYNINDTVMLTDGEAKYLIGLSIEPTAETAQILSGKTPVGEHRESGVDILEESRPFKDPEVHEDDDRSSKRTTRSTTARG